MTLQNHPIADVMPILTGKELKNLAADIAAHGIRNPIVLFEGKVLDGRNRLRAAKMARVTPKPENFKDFEGTWEEAVDFAYSENITRRHLSVDQCAMLGAKLHALKVGRPAKSEGETVSMETNSLSKIAEKVGVSRASVARAKRILDQGVPEVAHAVEAGEVGVRAASDIVVLPPEQQREVVAGGRDKVVEVAAELRSRPPAERRDLNPAQAATRRSRRTIAALNGLVAAVRRVEEANEFLAERDVDLNDTQIAAIRSAAQRLRTGADWLDTLLDGGTVNDEALAEWMRGKDAA